MKKLICITLSLVLLTVITPKVLANEAPNISAQAYILYCVENNTIIASKNENKRMKPASTTKLMTTLITLEQSASANKKVEFTKEMISEGSSMYLKVGDVLTLEDLATGMMMASGNDAANAASISISGSTEAFAKLMNKKAQQIGMKNTSFVTPSGLDNDNHYSTAYDLALLMSYALENDDFAELTAKKSATVEFIKPQSKQTTYSNHNRLLSMYPDCIGGKTGYTMAAGRCLVSAARKNGVTLVCVTLNDRNDWNDHISLYDYGFEQYTSYSSDETAFVADIPCVGGVSDVVTVNGERPFSLVLPYEKANKVKRKIYIESFIYAPVKASQKVGKIVYILDGKCVGKVNIIAVNKVDGISQ